MSNTIYDFLLDSPLFNDEYIQDNYSRLTDKEIKKILSNYREYVLSNKKLIFDEIKTKDEQLTIQTESFDNFLPDNELLKQMALYMDKVVINDPLFSMTDLEREGAKEVNSYLGFDTTEELNRKALISNINYFKKLTPMIVGQYVKFIPMSYVHEQPKQINIRYSENYYSDVLPKETLEWFHQHTKVHNLIKSSNGWMCKYREELEPGRAIIIDFEGHNGKNSNIYYLFETEMIKCNEDTRILEMAYTLPDTPPDKPYFDCWVNQSINQSAQAFYTEVFREVYNASIIGGTYLTTSPFVSNLLNRDISKRNNFESDIAKLVLNLDLPVINSSSVEKIMYVRNNDGEAFNNFRVQLRKQLRELRKITDPNDLKCALENVSHELNEVQIHEVNKKYNQLKKDAFADLAIFFGSLSTSIQTGGFSLLGCAAALAKGYKDYTTYTNKVKENPGYFLWKVKK